MVNQGLLLELEKILSSTAEKLEKNQVSAIGNALVNYFSQKPSKWTSARARTSLEFVLMICVSKIFIFILVSEEYIQFHNRLRIDYPQFPAVWPPV